MDPNELDFIPTVMAPHVWGFMLNYSRKFMLVSKYKLPDMYTRNPENNLASRLPFRVWTEPFLL